MYTVKLTDVDLAMQYCGIQVHELWTWHYAIHDTHARTTKKSTVWTGSGTKLVTRNKYRVNTVSEIMLGRRREISGREINAWDACLMQRTEAYQNLPTGYRILCTCIYKQSRFVDDLYLFPVQMEADIPCPLLFASSCNGINSIPHPTIF